MRYLALATDYDGTLAQGGAVCTDTLRALERASGSGLRLLLVTGREMDDIVRVFPGLHIFDRVVSENGAMIYRPEDRSEHYLAGRPPEEFLNALRRRKVSPLSVGRAIIASLETEAAKIADAIRECGLDLEIILNKGSAMALPAGVNKATGLLAALRELRISPQDLVAAGDAENDIPMLELAGLGVAVAGALESVKRSADIVMSAGAGEGIIELIERLLADDLRTTGEKLDTLVSRGRGISGRKRET
jgi:hypothetical protein